MNSLMRDIFTVRATSITNLTPISTDVYRMTSTASPATQLVIDGVQVELNDWVFLRAQLDNTQNGIYQVSRVADVENNITWELRRIPPGANLFQGMLIYTAEGTSSVGKLYRITSAEPITVGVSAITSVEGPVLPVTPNDDLKIDVLADNGVQVLENGTDGTDAWFKGGVKAANGGDIIIASTTPSTSQLNIGSLIINTSISFSNVSSQILGPPNFFHPSYSFFGNADTGFGYAGTNSINFRTGGQIALSVDPSQNISTSVGNTLTLTPSTNYTITHTSTADSVDFSISQTGSSDSSLIFISEGTGTDAFALLATAATSGIDINSGSGGIDINTTGSIPINADDISLTADNDIDLNSGTAGITVDTTADISFNTNVNMNFTTTTGNLNIINSSVSATDGIEYTTTNVNGSYTSNAVGGGVQITTSGNTGLIINSNYVIIASGIDAATNTPTLSLETTNAARGVHLQTLQNTAPTVTADGTIFTAASVVGSDMAGIISFTSGVGTGTLTLTFNGTYFTAPRIVIFTTGPGDALTQIYTTYPSPTTTQIIVTAIGTAAVAATINYLIINNN